MLFFKFEVQFINKIAFDSFTLEFLEFLRILLHGTIGCQISSRDVMNSISPTPVSVLMTK